MEALQNNLIRLPLNRLPVSSRRSVPAKTSSAAPKTLVFKRPRLQWDETQEWDAQWLEDGEEAALGSANPWQLYRKVCFLRGYEISCLDCYT